MTLITYVLCPRCNKIQHTRTVSGDDSETIKSYVEGKPCDGGCTPIRTAKQKPPNYKRKK